MLGIVAENRSLVTGRLEASFTLHAYFDDDWWYNEFDSYYIHNTYSFELNIGNRNNKTELIE